MENMLPTIKVYKIDYDFIIKNYLNPEMWKKTWTLFQYKKFVITLELSFIDCQCEKVWFIIRIKDNDEYARYKDAWSTNYDKMESKSIDYSLKINDISFLKRSIISTVFTLINRLEEDRIRTLEDYEDLEERYENERDILTQIAKDFLDDNGVTNEDIRDAYVDTYVSNNTKLDLLKQKLLNNYEYQVLTDLYLVFAHSTKNEEIIEDYESKTKEVPNIESIKKEVEEYLEYMETEEFKDDMSGQLESI